MGKAWFEEYPEISKEFENLTIVDSYFEEGYWLNHKDQRIKRAIYGQKIKFMVKMDKNLVKPGDKVLFSFYNNTDWGDPTDHLYISSNKQNSSGEFYVKINENHEIIIDLSSRFEKFINYSKDNMFELYFWFKYKNEEITFPKNKEDYLKLNTIVIDRYKMPGLNKEGDGIAEDMAYGTGIPTRNNQKHKKVYTPSMIADYKNEYKNFGFDSSKHALFSDKDDSTLHQNLTKNNSNNKNFIKNDHTRVAGESQYDLNKKINSYIKSRNKNVKAIYDKKEIYDFKTTEDNYHSGEDIKIGNDQSISNDKLFEVFNYRVNLLFSRGLLQDNINKMIAKFKRNEGGVYEHKILTDAIIKDPNTTKYCTLVEDYIAEQLKNNFSKLEDVEDIEPYFFNKEKNDYYNNDKRDKNFNKPSYSYENILDKTEGLKIALNDIWATEVLLKQIKFNDDNYTAKYEVTLWDHFGLDEPDMKHDDFNQYFYVKEVFAYWFVLQHLRGYKPFITKITFTKEFNWNINKGAKIRKSERDSIEIAAKESRDRADAPKAKMMIDIVTSPKY